MEGLVFDIQRFCTHDGPGIRTTVFLKGCPLTCPWCHNPESKHSQLEILFRDNLCIDCKACEAVCPQNEARDILLRADRMICSDCWKCTEVCPSGAIKLSGRMLSVEQVMKEVLADSDYYDSSGGGMTISGGEPLAQIDFTCELSQRAHKQNIHVCVETSGWAATEKIKSLIPYVDLWLWDIKDTNPERFQEYTGADLECVLANLRYLDDQGIQTLLRCIMLNGINTETEHYRALTELHDRLRHCLGVELIGYHALGNAKLQQLGYNVFETNLIPTEEQIRQAVKFLDGRLIKK